MGVGCRENITINPYFRHGGLAFFVLSDGMFPPDQKMKKGIFPMRVTHILAAALVSASLLPFAALAQNATTAAQPAADKVVEKKVETLDKKAMKKHGHKPAAVQTHDLGQIPAAPAADPVKK